MDHRSADIQQQLAAMGSAIFETGIYRDGRMLLRTWDADKVLSATAWLSRENSQGANIYIRPHGEHDLTMIDDLTRDAVARMRSSGFDPAVVVETSPGNFQAWVKHAVTLDRETSTTAARVLAERFGGDMGSADWRHFGRCCSFTNRKTRHRNPQTGLFPFVQLIEARGAVYPNAEDFVAGNRRGLEEKRRERDRLRAQTVRTMDSSSPRRSIADFRNDPRYGAVRHGADLAYSVYALAHGATEAEVEAAIRTRDLSHKGAEKRVDDYIARTIHKARERVGRVPER